MAKATGFRIFGNELDRADGYVDANVVGADADGNIYVKDVDTVEEWKLSTDDLKRLYDEDLIIEEQNVDKSHGIWGDLDTVTKTRQGLGDGEAFVDAAMQAAQRSLFHALVEASQ